MQAGYIKLYRQLMENPLWLERPFSRGQAWVDLILMANFTDGKLMQGGRMQDVPCGCLITSESYLMDRWGWGKSKLRSFLQLLEKEQMIDRKADRNRTSIHLRKYRDFQDSQTTDRPHTDYKQTADRPLTDHNIRREKGKKNNNYIYTPPYTPPRGSESEASKASSGESLTVAKMAGGAAKAADHSKTRMDESFDRFWAAYPRKVDKQRARKAWDKLCPDARLVETILSAVEAQSHTDQWNRDNGQYIPYPSSWLSGRRWDDENQSASCANPKQHNDYAAYNWDLVEKMLAKENGGE